MTVEIPLTRGKVALVDDADFPLVGDKKWNATTTKGLWYAVRTDYTDGKRTQRMHRVILNLTDPKIQVDHIDGDGLNNQRSNLRQATTAENCRNTKRHRDGSSLYKGVSKWNGRGPDWKAQIMVDGYKMGLGYFDTELEAAKIYDMVAEMYFGEFARTNKTLGLL